jgi:SAM-dependent methyltransferase
MNDREHWDNRYRVETQPPWDTGRVSLELSRRVAQTPIRPCRAIEFGCGTGTNAIWLAQQGFDVTAIDISPTAIDRARQRATAAGVAVQLIEADVSNLPDLGGPFSFLFDRGCYHAVRRTRAEAFLQSFERSAAPGALAVVLTGNAHEERKPGPPVVSEAVIRTELGRGFEILDLVAFRFDQDEPDGHRHLGWSILLRRRVD